MQSTPDLSKIVSLIMQNPELIEQISALAKGDNESVAEPEEESTEISVPTSTAEPQSERSMRAHRHELLTAMKPYLSESRRTAIDSMASILDIIDVMVKK